MIRATAWTVFFLGALIAVPIKAVEYKCKGPDGVWATRHCPGAGEAAKADAEKKRLAAAKQRAGELRQEKWQTLCRESGGNYLGKCAREHAEKYDTMDRILTDPSTPEELRSRAAKCYTRWNKSTIGVVDARMWRYCYVNW